MNKYFKILVCIASCLAVGYISGQATQSSVLSWLPTLKAPAFNPPSWVFAPVWSLLYTMMGIAAGLVWHRMEKHSEEVKIALVYFGVQLVLNGLWSVLFFGLQNPFLALVEIVLLWLMIYETYAKFRKIDKVAGYMLVPYQLWVTFATLLNAGFWWLNR